MNRDTDLAYRVGDIVRVKDLEGIWSSRQWYSGKCVTIAESYIHYGTRFYRILEDGGINAWIDGMFSELRDSIDDAEISDADFLEVLSAV